MPQPPPRLGSTTISLALQGGASLGAYTWGVLDAILADARLDIEGVTGASAGAINAAALGVGLASNGRDGARDALRGFWHDGSRSSASRRSRAGPFHGYRAGCSPVGN